VLGQLGEAPKLDQSESMDRARRVRRMPVPVIVGVTAPGFAAMRALSREAMAAGAAGVMIAPPNTLRTDDQIVGYYRRRRGDRRRHPLRDPGLSAHLQRRDEPGVIRRIVTDNPSCVMLKHEDWPGLEKISTLRGWERDGSLRASPSCAATAGCSSTSRWSRGADGAMTGYCFPEMLVGRGRALRGRPARRRARPVRCAPAAGALRAAARRRPGGAQVRS
jgi:4-hydroxy-tetrahydrodipicolinate synthase